MKTLLFTICSFSALTAIAQTQSADYNRLSAATKNAFSVAERQYTYKIEFKPGTNNSTASGNSPSSSNTGSISGDYSAYPAVNVNQRRLEKQAEAGERQAARLAAFDIKMKQVDELIRSRGLQRKPEFQPRLVQAAIDGGLTPYEASRFFGNSPEEYRNMLVSKNAADYSWSGGIKGDCQGDCVENLTSPYGFTYTGNAKYGKPHGKGKMIGAKATYTGDFLAGEPNGQVTVKWNSGNSFTGYVWNGEITKGIFTQSGLSFQGTFINGTYYRGLMKVDGVELLGEFSKTPSFVMGMKAYSNGDTTYGYYTGSDEKATYYQMKALKSGFKIEKIFDDNHTAIGDVRYYGGGEVFFTVPYSENKRLGWLINTDGIAYYAYYLTDVNKISPIENISAEQLPLLKKTMQDFMNEVQRRREEYKEKMEQVYEAIKL